MQYQILYFHVQLFSIILISSTIIIIHKPNSFIINAPLFIHKKLAINYNNILPPLQFYTAVIQVH